MKRNLAFRIFVAATACATVLFIIQNLTSRALAVSVGQPSVERDGQRDFDFLTGSWAIHLKKRLHPLSGSNEWIEFDGTVVCRHIWDGKGEVEEFFVDSAEKDIHIQGLATRLYDPKSRQWRIYWANSQNGFIDAAPQIGQFQNGRGEFYGQDTLNGKPIYVRFVWTDTTTAAPHFEQAFSEDGGRSWETNWITDQRRVK